MSRRRLSEWVVAATLFACPAQAEPQLLAKLDVTPAGIATWRDAGGDENVAVASIVAGRLRITSVRLDGDNATDDWNSPEAEYSAPIVLLAARSRLAVFGQLSGLLSPSTAGEWSFAAAAGLPDGAGKVQDVAFVDGRVFVATRGRIYRQRLTDRGLTDPRPVFASEEIGGLATSPRGYLVVLHRDAAANAGPDASAWRLGFFNPRVARLTGAALPVDGIGEPIQLAYGGANGEHLLLLSDDGVARLNTAIDPSGRQRATAVRLTDLAEPVAMAQTSSGRVVVAQSDGQIVLVEPQNVSEGAVER